MLPLRGTAAALATAVFACGCGGHSGNGTTDGSGPEHASATRLVPVPPTALRLCRGSRLLRSACPTRMPRVQFPRLLRAFLCHGGDRGCLADRVDVFDIAHGGEDPQRLGTVHPPQLVHITIYAGRFGGAARSIFPFPWPRGNPVSEPALSASRRLGVTLGTAEWNGRRGELALAPPYDYGGQVANHVIFRWRKRGTDYAASLHAWTPIEATVAVLRAIVESMPGEG